MVTSTHIKSLALKPTFCQSPIYPQPSAIANQNRSENGIKKRTDINKVLFRCVSPTNSVAGG
ncbi:TPA: hypothetical protein DCR79_00530 [Patescibacteria group bacterium]|nr:hypothetical protein [Patescibacteria group bacterium]